MRKSSIANSTPILATGPANRKRDKSLLTDQCPRQEGEFDGGQDLVRSVRLIRKGFFWGGYLPLRHSGDFTAAVLASVPAVV